MAQQRSAAANLEPPRTVPCPCKARLIGEGARAVNDRGQSDRLDFISLTKTGACRCAGDLRFDACAAVIVRADQRRRAIMREKIAEALKTALKAQDKRRAARRCG